MKNGYGGSSFFVYSHPIFSRNLADFQNFKVRLCI